MLLIVALIASLVSLLGSSVTATEETGAKGQITLRMPDIRPDHAEQYLCIAHRIPVDNEGQFIVGFNPLGSMDRVHHMLVYGCQKPGILQRDSPNFVWDCGEMQSSVESKQEKSYLEGKVCEGSGMHILYGWALDAPALKLPKSVGFKVGGRQTDIKYLILQVHYGHFHAFLRQPDLTDNSGLILDTLPNKPESGITKQAGILILVSLGQVGVGKSKHEIWCDIKDDIVIHPFRYRVHTHKLGTRVMGAKIGAKHNKSFNFGLDKPRKFDLQDNRIIGVGNPQKPQIFYPVKEKDMTLAKGDSVYAHCEFNNNRTHVVEIGNTGDDEMCNFYLMYWTDSPKLLQKSNCYGFNQLKAW